MVELPREGETPCSAHCTSCTTCARNVRGEVFATIGTGHSIPSGLDTDEFRQKAVERAIREEVGIN